MKKEYVVYVVLIVSTIIILISIEKVSAIVDFINSFNCYKYSINGYDN